MENATFERMNPAALGRAMSVLWMGAVVVLGVIARVGWGDRWRDLLADVYVGYDSTTTGLVVGAIWALLDGFAGGYLLASLYNYFLRATN